jgi:hypothetical protein
MKRRIIMKKYYNPIYDDSCKNPIVPDEEEIFSIDEVFPGANLIYSIDMYFAYQGKIVEKWDVRNTLFYSKGKVLQDYLSCAIGWPLVSLRVKEIFEDLNIYNVQFLPVNIKDKKTNNINSEYFVLNTTTMLTEAIDLKQTKHKYVKDGKGKDILWISDPRPRVFLSKISEYDIFRIKEVWPKIYISDRLVSEFRQRKISGFDYVEVITV